jgi:predicted metalloprotease with PDZ domain
MEINDVNPNNLELILPDWRPGRYELTNYAANIGKIQAYDQYGSELETSKKEKNKWAIFNPNPKRVLVSYTYYAFKMDAGSSYVDEEQIYVNFINCLLYLPNRMSESVEVFIDIPDSYKSTCSLENFSDTTFFAKDYYELVDSPFLSSETLKCLTYYVSNSEFNIVIQGNCPISDDKLIEDFRKFTVVQLEQMKGLPSDKFDFIIQSLDYRHYHGVEHRNSTVLVLGPNAESNQTKYYQDLMGVASHELFHAWNVTRIRPKELSPYDFSKENYYETGFITEGVTTYYGDLFLARGEIFTEGQYFDELNKLFKRHFENYGRHNLSLTESSFDLWVDGYKKILPNRKVSIYVKGAILSFMLDLTIRKITNDKQSIDDLIYELWQEFGKKEIGYTKQDIYDLISKYIGALAAPFIKDYYDGVRPVEQQLSELLQYIGCELVLKNHPEKLASLFGFRGSLNEGFLEITEIAPSSIAEEWLAVGDKVLSVNGKNINEDFLLSSEALSTFSIERNSKIKSVELVSTADKFYQLYEIRRSEGSSEEVKSNYKKWLKGE